MQAGSPILERELADEAATGRTAQALARDVRAGDIFALEGGLGAGKTAFARAFVNALPGAAEDVPSPTFTLVQSYDRGDLTLYHFDLYRLEDPDEAFELGIEDAFHDGVSLIEWPERLGTLLPKRALIISFKIGDGSARHLSFIGDDAWRQRLAGAFAHG